MGAKGRGWQLEKCREDRMGAHTLALPLQVPKKHRAAYFLKET